MPLMGSSSYARYEFVALQKRNSGTDKFRAVVPSEWAILDSCTAPLFDALISLHLSSSTTSGSSFVFDDIENTAFVRHGKSVVDAYGYIFMDANQEEDAAQFSKLPVPAGPGCRIEIKVVSSIEAYSILGTETGVDMQSGTTVQLEMSTIVSLWDVCNDARSFSGTRWSLKPSSNCRTMKPGDTGVEVNPI
jgi:hypothetical protein